MSPGVELVLVLAIFVGLLCVGMTIPFAITVPSVLYLLLPGIKDIKTTEEQLLIARKKGGITPDEPISIERFEVDRFEEPD